jgi:hypothetical protein
VCAAALLQGQLVPHPQWGIAIRDPQGVTWEVLWPADYSAVSTLGGLFLLDGSGREIARTGDWVEVGGGETGNFVWLACSIEPVRPWDPG